MTGDPSMISKRRGSHHALSPEQRKEIEAEVKQAALDHLNAKDAVTALNHYMEEAVVISNGFLYPSFQTFAEHVETFYSSLSRINLARWDDIYISMF